MSDDATAPGEQRVEIDDPFEVPEEVDEAWEEDANLTDEAPSG